MFVTYARLWTFSFAQFHPAVKFCNATFEQSCTCTKYDFDSMRNVEPCPSKVKFVIPVKLKIPPE